MKHFIFIIFNLFSVSVFSQNIIIGFAIPVDSISNIDSEKVPFRFTILDHHFPDAAQIFIPQIEMTKKHHCSKDKLNRNTKKCTTRLVKIKNKL